VNSTRILVALTIGAAALLSACGEDTKLPPAPDKPPQIAPFSVTHSTGTGLPSNEVTAFLKTSTDEFWVGTHAGVARYSSVSDARVDTVVTEITGLPHPQVTCMVEHDGTVYVGTWGGGIAIYYTVAGIWDQVRPGQLGLGDGFISDAAVSPSEGRVYFSTNDGVYILDTATVLFSHESTVDPALDTEDPDNFDTIRLQKLVSAVEVTSGAGTVERWYGPRVEERIAEDKLEDHGIMVSKTPPNTYWMTPVNSGLLDPNVNDIFYDGDTGTYWVAYASRGLSQVDVASSTWTRYDLTDGLPSNTVNRIARAKDNASGSSAIWVATENGLAKLVDGKTKFESYGESAGLPSNRVRSVYNDGARLWAGFYDSGAVRLE
jgi:ligand-binding sensor domain-containing protein